jgi:O-antigen/teichoic acid export membrane protein
MRKTEQLYRAQVRLHALVGLVAAVVLVATSAPLGAVYAVAIALGVLWGVLTYVRLHHDRSRPSRSERFDRSKRLGDEERSATHA